MIAEQYIMHIPVFLFIFLLLETWGFLAWSYNKSSCYENSCSRLFVDRYFHSHIILLRVELLGHVCSLIYVYFWGATSGVTPGGAWETVCSDRNWTGIDHIFAPCMYYFILCLSGLQFYTVPSSDQFWVFLVSIFVCSNKIKRQIELSENRIIGK